MKTAVLYHRSAETYPSEYKTGTSTIFQKLFSKQNLEHYCFCINKKSTLVRIHCQVLGKRLPRKKLRLISTVKLSVYLFY